MGFGGCSNDTRNNSWSFIWYRLRSACGDRVHALWADDYLLAMLKFGAPNLEMHIYGNGFHPGSGSTGGMTDCDGTPMGMCHLRFISGSGIRDSCRSPAARPRRRRTSRRL